jgi:asparagine synthase (glutamine-hydrolysing)
MSGLCGWFRTGGAPDPTGTIEHMAHALPSYGLIRANAASGPNFGLALQTHPMTGAFAVEPEIVAAIEGYPQWSDAALSDIARSEGHARALLVAYKRKGAALFDMLRGTFTLAILDLAAKKTLCAIDRFGVQTLCYAQPAPGLIVFGSTTDAVRAHPAVGATIPVQSIFDYLYFVDRLAAPTTIYREQRKLAPGEYLLADAGKATVAAYWQMPYRSGGRIEKTAAVEELKTRLRDAVKANLEGEDASRVGAFLSGGLDSSSVVGMAAGLLPQQLRTFTIGFPVEGFDEAAYADIAARQYGTKHEIYYLQPPDVIDILLKAVKIYDEPFANSSLIPAYHCARIAKEAGVAMLLAGDGGDELFAGNKRYADDAVFDHYARLPTALRKGVLEPLGALLSFARSARGPLGKGLRYVARARQSVPERMADNLFQALSPSDVLAPDALREIDTRAPQLLADSIYDGPRDASKVQRMMQLDLRVTLADTDLRKVVRMCELAGVRTRFPFLHDDLAEFSARLPETLLMEGGKLRQFYKDAMRGFLPDAIIDKQKHGFGLPYTAFMNSHTPLRDLVCDSLTSLKRRGYFRAKFLDELTERARGGNLSGHETVAWDLVVLELWLASRT